MRDDFAIFICTHGRPVTQTTLNTLRRCGYTGKAYLVLDDTDPTIQEYIDNFGPDDILVFDKNHYINSCDTGSNTPYYKTILYAKNAVEDMAKALGLKYFVISDDDIFNFRIRYPDGTVLRSHKLFNMDGVLENYVGFMEDADLAMLGFATMLYAGANAFDPKNLMNIRVPYNFCIRCADKPVNWIAAYGEDIVTTKFYQRLAYRTLVIPYIQIETIPPGSSQPGGMDQTYSDYKHGIAKFLLYFLMFSPGTTQLRSYTKSKKSNIIKILAAIKQNCTFPKIVSVKYRKDRA